MPQRVRRLALLAWLLCEAANAVAASASEPAPIPFRQERVVEVGSGRVAAAIGLTTLGGVAALLWLRRRARAGLPTLGRRLKIIERLRVSPRTTLLLVECDGREVLLGEQAGALVLLSDRAVTPEAPHA